jgi:hypothetical protein
LCVEFSLGVGSTYSGTAGAWTSTSFISSVTGATSVVGTNGATFYITGVQLEKGSTATSFDYRPYGTELALCQRYFCVPAQTGGYTLTGFVNSATNYYVPVKFPVTMRASPTITVNGTIGNVTSFWSGSSIAATAYSFPSGGANTAGVESADIIFTVSSGLTTGQAVQASMGSGNSIFCASEL